MHDEFSPSRTAQVMALFRALETLRSPRARLFTDPLAKHFVRSWGSALLVVARISPARRLIEQILDRLWPGDRTSAIARTRLIDDLVCDALREGVPQILFLGAGFDSRPYRLPGISRARVFEVDQPATQQQKIQTLTRWLGSRPRNLIYIPADLRTQTLESLLRASGFDSDAPSFVAWEGVTNYLSEAAVDGTLRALARVVASGSRMVFTYIHSGLLDGS